MTATGLHVAALLLLVYFSPRQALAENSNNGVREEGTTMGSCDANSRLNEWLRTVGLDPFVDLSIYHALPETPAVTPMQVPANTPEAQTTSRAEFKHEYVLTLHTELDQSAWYELDQEFIRRVGGLAIDIKLLFKFSSIAGVSARQLLVRIEGSCFSKELWIERSRLYGKGRYCLSGGAATTIDMSKLKPVSGGVQDEVTADLSMIGQAIDRIVSQRFIRGRITKLAEDPGYWEYVVTGGQDYVLAPRRLWERLQISFMYFPNKDKSFLRCMIDGQYGAGAVEPGVFDLVDMEPEHSKLLQEFTRALLSAVKSELQHITGK
jgi:hypothetical protein